MDKEKAIFPESREITIGYGDEEKTFAVNPLVRKKYKKLFKIIGDIVKDFIQGEQIGNEAIDLDNLESNIPLILSTAGDKVGEVYAFVLDVDKEWIDNNMLPQQEIELIDAIVERNDIQGIVKNLKKMAKNLGLEKLMKQLSSNQSVQNTQ